VPCPLCRKRIKLPALGTDFCHLSSKVTLQHIWKQWDLCWAKCDDYPYWPGVIVELRETDQLVCVVFYDSGLEVAESRWFSTRDDFVKDYASNHK
jgi:hypothetical protein